MDNTLLQILAALFTAHQELGQLRETHAHCPYECPDCGMLVYAEHRGSSPHGKAKNGTVDKKAASTTAGVGG